MPVGDPGGLDDREIGGLPDRREPGHHVDECDESVVVDLDLPAAGTAHHIENLAFRLGLLDLELASYWIGIHRVSSPAARGKLPGSPPPFRLALGSPVGR